METTSKVLENKQLKSNESFFKLIKLEDRWELWEYFNAKLRILKHEVRPYVTLIHHVLISIRLNNLMPDIKLIEQKKDLLKICTLSQNVFKVYVF